MRVHIVGAGIAGLAAAVQLAARGTAVRLYEAAPRAGGRCRSHHDTQIGGIVDNGNHLLMSGNHATMAYLDTLGARNRLAGPATAVYPFLDVASGARWSLRPSHSLIPWWILDRDRRVPETTPASYLSALRLLLARPDQTVADLIPRSSSLYRNFWEPLTLAVLNTAPDKAAATLLRSVLMETFLKGADACRPLMARESLADALVDPALAYLAKAGAEVRLGCRIRALAFARGRVERLEADDGHVALGQNDMVVIAVPPWVAETLVPGLTVPPSGETIVNVHYRLPRAATMAGEVKFVGIVDGLVQWVFLRGDLASATISAAGSVADENAETIATRCWRDVSLALNDADASEPPSRVIKEKRATFAQTPDALPLRPQTATHIGNLLLAGDWTATGLPATIEGAVRSGIRAATLAGTKDRLVAD